MSRRKGRIIFLGLAAAAIALVWVRQAKIAALFRQGNSNDMRVRVQATRILLDRGVIPDALPSQEVIVRSKISKALAEVGGQRAIDCLLRLLSDFEDAPRRWAREALVKIGPSALPALGPVLLTDNENAKKAALEALGRMGPPAVPFLRRLISDPASRTNACIALGNVGASAESPEEAEEAFRPLIHAVSGPDYDLANDALPVLGEKQVKAALEPLRKALAVGDIRFNAIVALGDIGDPNATIDLIPFLSDSDVGIRTATARALGQIGDPRAASRLVSTLGEENADYRSAVILALQRIGAPAAGLLVEQLRSPDLYVRRAAARSLQGDAVPASIPALRQALSDPDAEVRASAASALGWRGNVAAIPLLLEALHDKDGMVVDAAIAAFAEIGPTALPTLHSLFSSPDPAPALYASRAIVQMGDEAAPSLVAALDSTSQEVQLWAVITLADMGYRPAVKRFREMYGLSQGRLRVILWRALSELGASLPPSSKG